MSALAGYTPQTRPLRRIIKGLQVGLNVGVQADLPEGSHAGSHKTLHVAPNETTATPTCAGCGGELNELARARVFVKREDGQRYRCVSCGSRYISFMGNLLPL